MQTTLQHRGISLDAQRIVAVTGAVAFNALIAALLIAPLAAPQLVGHDPLPPQVFDMFKPPVVVKKIADPVPVTHATQQADAKPQVPHKAKAAATEPPLSASKKGDTPAEHTDESRQPQDEGGTTGTGDGDIGPPASGVHLEYASAPPPPYPREAMLDGTTGTVILQVRVGVDGKPLDVTIARSSGSRLLDAAARRQVLARWTFRPAMRDGQAIEAVGLVPVEFRLN